MAVPTVQLSLPMVSCTHGAKVTEVNWATETAVVSTDLNRLDQLFQTNFKIILCC